MTTIIAFMFLTNANAQPIPLVSDVFGAAEDSINGVIDNGFERLDRSVISFGHELERLMHVVRRNYSGALDESVKTLEGAQKTAIEDIQNIIEAIENAEIEQLSDVLDAQRQTVDKIYGLFSDKAIVTQIEQLSAMEGDANIEVRMTGASLKVDDVESINFNGEKFEPNKVIDSGINSGMNFKFPLPSLDEENTERGVWFLPFNVTFKSCGFLSIIRGCETQNFRHSLLVFPKNLGTVTAVFSGTHDVLERVTQTRGPFTSRRVQTRVRGFGIRRGARTDIWTAKPTVASDGEGLWEIDVQSSRYSFSQNNSGCSNARSRASWHRREPLILQVRASTGSDSHVGATCTTNTSITYDEIRTVDRPLDITLDSTDLVFEGESLLKLPNSSNLESPQLSHIVITSNLLRESQEHRMILTPNDADEFGFGAIKAKYQPATSSVFISVD